MEMICSCFKELLYGVAHVKNLELGPSCIELLTLLELEGWSCPPSSRKFVKLNRALEHLDLPGFRSLLRSSSDLETMVIDWENHEPRKLLSMFTDEKNEAFIYWDNEDFTDEDDEDSGRSETDSLNRSLLHLKTIKIIHFHGPLSANKFILPLVEYLLKNARVLEKLVIVARFKEGGVSRDYVAMAQELLSVPRSSPRASVVFSY